MARQKGWWQGETAAQQETTVLETLRARRLLLVSQPSGHL